MQEAGPFKPASLSQTVSMPLSASTCKVAEEDETHVGRGRCLAVEWLVRMYGVIRRYFGYVGPSFETLLPPCPEGMHIMPFQAANVCVVEAQNALPLDRLPGVQGSGAWFGWLQSGPVGCAGV